MMKTEVLMTVYCFFVENELHRVFATADLAERYLQTMQEEALWIGRDVDFYYVNMIVEDK